MPHFDIVKKCEPSESFRVAKIKADFDVKNEHAAEHFVGDINLPDHWNIGLIYGNSGTGKTTIAKEIFGDRVIERYQYNHKSVVDDMPDVSINEITRMFYAVGFGSVPSWLKPYDVLSNGEKMRVNLARAMLSDDLVVFDEFTSVVDRTVAKTVCIAINKAVKREDKQFVAVSCHNDIIEWLCPDWVLDTNTMKSFFGNARDLRKNMPLNDAKEASGQSLGVITI